MTTTSTDWRVPKRWLPVLCAALIAEAASNALRAYMLGTHLEHFTVDYQGMSVSIAGVIMVLAAIAVAGSQSRAAWVALTPTSPARVRITAGIIGALLLTVSCSAMASHLLEANRAKTADEGGAKGAHDRAKADYQAAADELERLKAQRSTEEVAADLAKAPVSRAVFNRTKQCTEVTRQDSFEACKPILELREENGRALRKRSLEMALPGLRKALDAAPPVVEASVTEAHAASVWAWLMGFAVVFLATFGSVIFARVERMTSPATPAPADLDRTGQSDYSGELDPALLRWNGSEQPAPNVPPRRPRGGGRRTDPPNRPKAPDSPAAGRPDARRFARDEVLMSLQSQLARGERFESQGRMVERFGVPKSTLSDWLTDWEAAGAIPARRTVGRCKALGEPADA